MSVKKCFVICPIGDAGSDARKRSDGILREIVRPVAEELGYSVERADEDKAPGIVTDTIISKIIDADLVVADLHGHNPNVMYELAIRHASDGPLVQMIEQGEKLPFDIGGLNTVFYESSMDGMAQWRGDLRASIESIAAGRKGSNPVSRAGLFRTIARQENGEGQGMELLLEAIKEVRYEVGALRGATTRGTSTSKRMLALPEQVMYTRLSSLIEGHPKFGDHKMLLQVNGKKVILTIVGESIGDGSPSSFDYDFEYEPTARLYDEVDRLSAMIVRDVTAVAKRPAHR